MISRPAGALPAGLGAAPFFVPDVVVIKGDNQERESTQKTLSQRTKSAISKMFDAVNIVERQFPRIVPLAFHYRSSGTKDCGGGGER
jgi:hypothetical protein